MSKTSDEKKPEEITAGIKSLIHRTSAWCAGVGVALSPIPLLDELALFPMYNVLSWRIARRHKLKWKQIPWRPILNSTTAGLVARAGVNITFAVLPGVSAVGSAATAAALTEILGHYVDDACNDPVAAKTLTVRNVFDMLKSALLKKKGAAVEPTPAVIVS